MGARTTHLHPLSVWVWGYEGVLLVAVRLRLLSLLRTCQDLHV